MQRAIAGIGTCDVVVFGNGPPWQVRASGVESVCFVSPTPVCHSSLLVVTEGLEHIRLTWSTAAPMAHIAESATRCPSAASSSPVTRSSPVDKVAPVITSESWR